MPAVARAVVVVAAIVAQQRTPLRSTAQHDTHGCEVRLALPGGLGVAFTLKVAARKTNHPGWQRVLLLFMRSSKQSSRPPRRTQADACPFTHLSLTHWWERPQSVADSTNALSTQ
jgi:hypothetical protein